MKEKSMSRTIKSTKIEVQKITIANNVPSVEPLEPVYLLDCDYSEKLAMVVIKKAYGEGIYNIPSYETSEKLYSVPVSEFVKLADSLTKDVESLYPNVMMQKEGTQDGESE